MEEIEELKRCQKCKNVLVYIDSFHTESGEDSIKDLLAVFWPIELKSHKYKCLNCGIVFLDKISQ